ncbi:hypothetical protein F383_15193 [Gossypium arboreum]|uniref:Uncharacterized protein n=1 Tax=Gossypium arboreum TaxID=29729 RepID=A0A0B0PEH1_GOSAR|nr:hypothetical protein F383_29288 [Gossypium arboreum]KHG30361.1 hypothetical protein F383_15193 [Gossypium arboreum]
MACSFGLGIG